MILTERQPGRLPVIPFSGAALVVSSAALVASLGIGSEIGGAVLYGVFLTCLVGATTLYTLGITANPVATDADGKPRSRPSLARWGGPDVDVALRRQTNTRLLALLSARNPTRNPMVIERVFAADPDGTRIARSDVASLDAPGEVTVDFESDAADIGLRVPPGESRTCGFYVLLPGELADSARARFRVELSCGEQRRELLLKRRIPR